MGNLSNLYVSRSFQSIIHLATDNTASANLIGLEDGFGNPIGVSVNTAGDLFLSGSLTASLQQGYIYVGNASGKTSAFATSSLVANINTGSLVTTSSFNSYTSSNNQRVSSLEVNSASVNTSISALNTFTASQSTASLVTSINNLNTFSASALVSISNLNTNSASVNTSITNINSATASLLIETQNLEIFSASALISISNLNASSASQQVSINALNTFTASQSTASLVTSINNLNTFSASTLNRLTNIESTTASLLIETQNLETFSASALISISNLNASSASQQVSINSLNAATSSYVTETESGSFLITASFDNGNRNLTFTKGNNTTFAVNIPDVSGSAGNFVTTSSFNAFTASTDSSISQLNASSASQQISINNLNTTTASLLIETQNLELFSASTLISISNLNASSASQQISINALNTNSASVNTSISALNTFTASQSTASLVTSINNLNTFSASALVSISNINSTTASLNTSVTNLNASSASQQISIDALNTFTQSQEGVNILLAGEIDSLQDKTGSYATTGSNNFIGNQIITGNITAFSASFTYLQTIFESSSVIYSSGSNQFGDELSDVQTLSGSVKVQGSLTVNGTPVLTSSVDISGLVTTASFNAYTSSNNQRVDSLESNSASVNISISNLNSTTQSLNTSISNLNTTTASLNTSVTNLNASSASQQISIDALNTNSASVNTSITNVNSATASLFTSVNNINTFTQSAQTSINALNGATSSYVTSAITASSLITASASGNTITFTKGNASTFSVSVDTGSAATTIFEVVYTGENITKGDPLYISGSQGANPIVFKADAADPNKMPVTFVSNETIGAANTTNAIVLGLIEGIDLTGYVAGQSIYVAEGGGWSASLPSGSNSVTQLLGVVTKGGSGGKGLVLNPGPAQLPGLDSGKLWVGGANNQPTEITTASFVSTASFNSYTSSTNVRLNNIESTTASLNTSVNNINSATASLFTSASLGLTTASFSGNTLTFTKGDATTFGVIIPDVSGSTINTGSFATTGSNTFNGQQNIAGANKIGFGTTPNDVYIHSPFNGVTSVDLDIINYSIAGGKTNINASNGLNLSAAGTGVSIIGNTIISGSNGLGLTGSLSTTGTFTSSLQQGYVWVGDVNGKTTTVATSSFAGSTINTGSFATTGSNTFNGNQIINGLTTINVGAAGTESQKDIIVVTGSVIDGKSYTNVTFGLQDYPSSGDNLKDAFAFDYYSSGYAFGAGFFHNGIRTGSELLASGSGNSFGGKGYAISQLRQLGTGSFLNQYASIINIGALPAATTDFILIGHNALPYLQLSSLSNQITGSTIISGSNGLRVIGNQTITGSLILSSSNAVELTVIGETQLTGSLGISGNLTSSLQEGYVWVGNSSGRTTTVATSSFGGGGGSVNTGSLMVTGSVAVNVLTFTKGDGSTFDLTVAASGSAPAGTISGSSQITELGFAITGSNTFRGNQTITGSVDVSGSAKQTFNAPTLGNQTDLVVVKGATVNGVPFNQQTIGVQNYDFGSDAYKNAFVIEAWDSSGYNFGGEALVNGETAQFLAVASGSAAGGTRQGVIGVFDNGNQKVKAVLSGQIIEIGGTGTAASVVTTVDSITIGRSSITSVISGSLRIQNTLTASLQQGHVLVGNASGRTTTVATSSFGGSTFPFTGNAVITGSLTVSGSVTIQGDTTFVNKSGNTSNVILGSNAMTNITGNVTSNVAIGAGAMRYTSGSTQCVAIGANALGITTGSNNFAIGAETLASNTTGNQNVAIGVGALNNNKTGNLNTAIGNDAGFRNVSGSRNVYIGPNAGNDHYGDGTIIIGGYSGGGQILNNNIILSDGNGNVELQYSGSTWTTENNFVVSGSLSAANDIKMGRGTDKPTNKVTVGSGGLIVSNSLVTADSYIFATNDTTVGNYSPVVSNITNGSFSLSNGGYGGNISVMYMIVNPY
jgi:uncharacterized coiled-coil protein SlyX